MKRFWNAWVRNGLEERHKYLVRTSFIQATSEFKTKERPKYLKCEQTITDSLQGAGNSSDFFKQRYAENTAALQWAPKISALIHQVMEKDQISNLFIKYGATQAETASNSGQRQGRAGTQKKQRR